MDSYTLAILTNALLTVNNNDNVGQQVLDVLNERRIKEGNGCYWAQEVNTGFYGADDVAVIEATALIAYSMLLGKSHTSTVTSAINYLITKKDSFGNWSSTQATIACLRTFIKSLELKSRISDGQVSIYVANQKIKDIYINSKNYDVLQMLDITPFIKKGDNAVSLSFESNNKDAAYLYQIAGSYYIPKETTGNNDFEPVSINVQYDKETLEVDDTIIVTVSVKNNYSDVNLNMMIIDLGVPPGFDVLYEDLNEYIGYGRLTKVEPAGRQIILYLNVINAMEELTFAYRIKARFPMKVTSPGARLYSYYGTEESLVNPPAIEVVE